MLMDLTSVFLRGRAADLIENDFVNGRKIEVDGGIQI